jgi:hypothetical protein
MTDIEKRVLILLKDITGDIDVFPSAFEFYDTDPEKSYHEMKDIINELEKTTEG